MRWPFIIWFWNCWDQITIGNVWWWGRVILFRASRMRHRDDLAGGDWYNLSWVSWLARITRVRLFGQFRVLGLGLSSGHLGCDSAEIHGLRNRGYCFGFPQWILNQSQKLKGWLAIVRKSVLMQCFEHLFLKHVLLIYNQFWLKTFDLKGHFEILKCKVLWIIFLF